MAADLTELVDELPLVDHHVHGATAHDLSRRAFEELITESDRPVPAWMTMFDSQLGHAILRHCAPELGLDPHTSPEEYLARRARLGADEVNRRLLGASGVEHYLLETGYRGEEILGPGGMAEVTGVPVDEVVRLEQVAEQVAASGCGAGAFARRFAEALWERTRTARGLKTVVAYRHGLDFDPSRPSAAEVAEAAGRWLGEGEAVGRRLGEGEAAGRRLGEGEAAGRRLGEGEAAGRRLGEAEAAGRRPGESQAAPDDAPPGRPGGGTGTGPDDAPHGGSGGGAGTGPDDGFRRGPERRLGLVQDAVPVTAADQRRRGWRVTDPVLLRHLIWTGLDRGLPLQFHTGFGDPDVDLRRADPLLLRGFVERAEPTGVPIMLLHCYPYVRHAGHLAHAYPAVHLDVGLGVTYTGARAAALVAQSLEVAPFAKLLFSSDAWGPAELHHLGATLWRRALARVLGEFVAEGEWSAGQAARVAAMVAAGNARRVYDLTAPRP
ncbi:amidohydrolase [Nonomuraea sp. SMC257]|uniref:Amidohydrolase n=1 Tax=Nonomuraea montanisoli TaxID=2741721 RepID=A0A7Y6I9U2_9ACTN|nr:amidohydrolase family protein [Nonomuraea montanisoli]NUW34304.1 amidohydrolase [Nonomuraea montanisoli]